MKAHGRHHEHAADPCKLITSIQEKDVTPSDGAFIRGSRGEAQLQAASHWLLINMIFTAND